MSLRLWALVGTYIPYIIMDAIITSPCPNHSQTMWVKGAHENQEYRLVQDS